jgi:hypothetical protein
MADVFTKLAYVLDQTGQDGGAIDVAYETEADQLQPGDLIPTVTFSLQRQKTANVVVDPDKVINVEPQDDGTHPTTDSE